MSIGASVLLNAIKNLIPQQGDVQAAWSYEEIETHKVIVIEVFKVPDGTMRAADVRQQLAHIQISIPK